jgi:hypothetical protein
METLVMELVRARFVENDCLECLSTLLSEAKSLGGLPLSGKFVIIPNHWLNTICVHGHSGLKFDLAVADIGEASREAEHAESEVEFEASESRIDATKNIGYPVREHGSYGSHPMHDDFDDESSPDGSGTY